jgi:hypothetical protein
VKSTNNTNINNKNENIVNTVDYLYIHTMATLSSSSTLGMQIDALLDEIDSLSSTQLYAIIVAVTVIVSFVLLGTGTNSVSVTDEVLTVTTPAGSSSSSSPSKDKTSSSSSSGPEPRWHIFRWINWLAIIAFVISVVEFGWNAQTYLHSTTDGNGTSSVLLHYLVGWSIFLAYFFGFFGVSFVHDIHAADHAQSQSGTGATTDSSADAGNARYVYTMCVLLPYATYHCIGSFHYSRCVSPLH